MRLEQLKHLGIASLLQRRPSPLPPGKSTIEILSAGLEEHPLTIDLVEHCDGSFSLNHEDGDTFLPGDLHNLWYEF
jgi:hypothetical protein